MATIKLTADEMIKIARNYWHTDGQIEIDDEPLVGFTEKGAYVEAWVFVPFPKVTEKDTHQIELFSTSKGD